MSSPSVADAASPAGTEATFFVTRSGSGPPSILSTTSMSVSSFSPWFVKLTVNSVSAPYAIRFAASGVSVWSPTCTESMPVPCRPGAGWRPLAPPGGQLLAERVGDHGRVEPLDAGQERGPLELLGPDVGVAQRGLDQRQHPSV